MGMDDQERLAFRKLRLQKWNSLDKGIDWSKRIAANRLNKRRHAKQVVRDFVKLHIDPLPRNLLTLQLLASFRPNLIMDRLVPNRQSLWRPISARRDKSHLILSNFSFIDDPHRTLELLKQVATADCTSHHVEIDFIDEYCKDIGPYLVLGLMQESLSPAIVGGRISSRIRKVLDAVDLAPFLGMGFTKPETKENILPFKLRVKKGRPQTLFVRQELNPTTAEKAVGELLDTINDWLSQISMTLNDKGKECVLNMVGEILDNAEKHASNTGDEGNWAIAAFMERMMHNGNQKYVCHLAIVSEGQSIHDSFSGSGQRVGNFIARYRSAHRNKRQCEETLSIVAAMQDRITSVPEKERLEIGGMGMMDVIDFISDLGDVTDEEFDPRITIISGNGCIQLRAPYIKGSKNSELSPRYQWMNASNSNSEKPDFEFAFSTDRGLAGTLITCRFAIAKRYIESSDDRD